MAKRIIIAASLLAVAPMVAIERIAQRCLGREIFFGPQAELLSLVPSPIGICLRAAFYHLSLKTCPLDVGVEFGAMFTNPRAEVGRGVYVGMRSIVGWARIGDETMLADHVQVLSGGRIHLPANGATGSLRSQPPRRERVEIGRDCWIGANAVLMASVGDGAIVGAGSVVTRPIPAHAVAAGVPARVLRSRSAGAP